MKNIYPQATKNFPDLMEYMPDPEDSKDRLPPRDFFFSIFGALKPNDFDQMIKDASAFQVP